MTAAALELLAVQQPSSSLLVPAPPQQDEEPPHIHMNIETQQKEDEKSYSYSCSSFNNFNFPIIIMSKEEIKRVALKHGGYATPSLNDQLYLHYKGYQRVENLEEYTNLKALWLDSNGLQTIDGSTTSTSTSTCCPSTSTTSSSSPLRHLTSLRCLFLQRNLLSSIGSTSLHGLTSLVQLDISENRLTYIDGLESLINLTNLNVSKNALMTSKSIEHLTSCPKLSSVDLSHNQLNDDGEHEHEDEHEDGDGDKGDDTTNTILHILSSSQIPTLLSLNMVGNPIVSKMANFRKRMIVSNKSLRYLDRPIFDLERASAEAWSIGGREAELKVKKEMMEKKRHEDRASMEQFRAWQAEVRAEAQQQERHRLASGGVMTPAQIATEEERQRRKMEREANAAMEAARERDIYRIEMPLDDDEGVSVLEVEEDDDDDDDTSATSDGSDSTSPVKITILEDPSLSSESPPSPPPPPSPEEEIPPPPLFVTRDEDVMDNKEGIQVVQNPVFTQEMDNALCKYVQNFEANFDQVAAKMSKDFLFETTCTRSQFASFTPDLCRIRWCLLDSACTGGRRASDRSSDDDDDDDDDTDGSIKRPLRSFQSPDQAHDRVTFQELCGMESEVMKKPVTFPSIDDQADEDGHDDDKNTTDA